VSRYESGKQSLYPGGDPDRHQNLIICSLAHCQPSLKISCKSVRTFLRKVANRLTTDKQTNKQRWKHNLLVWVNKEWIITCSIGGHLEMERQFVRRWTDTNLGPWKRKSADKYVKRSDSIIIAICASLSRSRLDVTPRRSFWPTVSLSWTCSSSKLGTARLSYDCVKCFSTTSRPASPPLHYSNVSRWSQRCIPDKTPYIYFCSFAACSHGPSASFVRNAVPKGER